MHPSAVDPSGCANFSMKGMFNAYYNEPDLVLDGTFAVYLPAPWHCIACRATAPRDPVRVCTDFHRFNTAPAPHCAARHCPRMRPQLGFGVGGARLRCARRVCLPSASSAPSSTARAAHGTRHAASIGLSPLGRCQRLRGRCSSRALGRSTNSAAYPPLGDLRWLPIFCPRAYPEGIPHCAKCAGR